MSLPESYACRSTLLASLEKLFAPHPLIPYPSQVYVYGNPNTGKSTVVKHALDSQHHAALWFDCREIYSIQMFYQTFIAAFSPSSHGPPTMRNFNDFVRVLRDCAIEDMQTKKKTTTSKTKSHSFVVLHHIELLLNYDSTGHLLYLLFKLNELTLGHFPHTLILIGHQPLYHLSQMNQIEAELGVLTPISIFVPAYTRTEIVTILQDILTSRSSAGVSHERRCIPLFVSDQQDIVPSSVGQLQIIIELALQIFFAVTNDLMELKDMSTMCIKDFLRSHAKKQITEDVANNDYRILYQKEFFMQVRTSNRLARKRVLSDNSSRFSTRSIRVR